MRTRNDWTRAALLAFVPWLATACGDGATGPAGSGGGATVSLSLAVAPQAPTPKVSGANFAVTLGDGANTLTLDRVAIVLRDIELELQNDDSCNTHVPGVDDNCEEFEVGPKLLELPLDGSVSQKFQVSGVPAGVYDEIELEVHKPSTPEDTAFVRLNPQFDGVSIRVEGSFNTVPFLYQTDLNAEQEITLAKPLTIAAGDTSPTNLTLTVDVDTWFRDQVGTLVDPVTANKGGLNESMVTENIKFSIDGFEDGDLDGSAD
ncbi:MAG: hypothetical protein ACE5HF_07385 [Gemmatimonadota bacterium]